MKFVRNKVASAGFSLTELLVVITIIALLSAAGGPAISALVSGGSANQNISQLSGILEQAREYAVAQNTYVWVAMYSPNAPTSATALYPNQVSVAVVASTDGTDPTNTSGVTTAQPFTVPGSGLALISKVVTLKQLTVETAATFNPPSLLAVTNTLSVSVTSTSNSINSTSGTNNIGVFNIKIPGTSTAQSFIPAIEFTPSGQARNSSSPIDVIDLDLQPLKGTANDPNNVAVLRLNGLTGEAVVYR